MRVARVDAAEIDQPAFGPEAAMIIDAGISLGSPCSELFCELRELATVLEAPATRAVEVTLKLRGERRTLAVSVNELREPTGVVGRVAVAHDVSNGAGFDMRYAERLFGVFH